MTAHCYGRGAAPGRIPALSRREDQDSTTEVNASPREHEALSAAAAPVAPGVSPAYCDMLRALQGGILFAFGLFLVYRLAGPLSTLLLSFLLVFILAAVFNPVVVWFHRRGVPRIASAMFLAIGILGGMALLGWLVLPPLGRELGQLFQNLPSKQDRLQNYYQDLIHRFPILANQLPEPQQLAARIGPQLTRLASQFGHYTLNVVMGLVSMLILLVLVVFTLANPAPLVAGLLAAAPARLERRVENALRRSLEQLKNWAFGSLQLGVIVGLMCAVGLWLVGKVTHHPFPYILLFSVIAGIGEMIPNIGPLLSAMPPVLIALTIDPMLGLWVALLFLVIQQTENNLIVPLVMGKSLDLHPVSLIFTVLVMGSLFGLLGAILAVPVAAILKVCWEEFYLIPRGRNVEELHRVANEIVANETHTAEAHQPPGESSIADEPKTERPPAPPRRRRAAS
jgi:predicted PurR-regulated permease PerM